MKPAAQASTQQLRELRSTSFAVAYRMLGSVAEAEDVVQEALLRVHKVMAGGKHLDSPAAFTTTVTTRLAIDELRTARARRERYIGEWLPEPIITEDFADPAKDAEIADSLSLALLVVLETLSPEQRAAFLLHDVFDYGYGELAQTLDKSEPAVRQLVSRARRRVEEHRPRFRSSREQRRQLAERFFAAAKDGDVAGLEKLLADDVVLTGDGGGKVPALARSLHGRSRVARTLRNWVKVGFQIEGVSLRPAEINGSPGALFLDGEGRVLSVMALDIAGSEVRAISSVVNPEKLSHLGAVGDVRTALRTR